jgi:beta-aspartyl-peptidase (threonine type)
MCRSFIYFLFLPIFACAIFVAADASFAQASNDAKAEVERVLRLQQEAWNNHNLEAFMSGYWNSPDLTFFSGAKERDGWQATLDRYRATYASPGHEMGKLEFSNLRIEPLSSDTAFVRRQDSARAVYTGFSQIPGWMEDRARPHVGRMTADAILQDQEDKKR